MGGDFSPLDWGIFNPIGFEFPGKETVQANVLFGVGGLYGFSEAIQEVGLYNRSPMPKKPTPSQVGPGSAWTTERVKPDAYRLGVF